MLARLRHALPFVVGLVLFLAALEVLRIELRAVSWHEIIADVVRTRMFLTDAGDWEEVARAHGETFADVRPAATAVVASLLDPAWKVEIEADAVLP